MTRLSSDHVLKENNTRDPSTIEVLSLNHRALSDVSCLKDFKSLERLDLRLNNLTSLEGLKLCTNLRWLSVAENKLESLKGIEALTQLTVLNAGKNKLKSMNDVQSITSLRAIILNDNEISSICRLDQMKELNTIVLSKNPIGEIGNSLMNVKSLTKLSLSYCQIRNISASLKSCVELKELRLAHNDIKSLPVELANNKDIHNLDLGYNAITTWSDVKVLSSFVSLKNLNLQGNPIAENEKSLKKIKNTFPNLHVFNAKPMNKFIKNDKIDIDSSLAADKDPETQTEEVKDHVNHKNSKDSVVNQERISSDRPNDFLMKKKLKGKKDETRDNEKRDQVKPKKSKHHDPDLEKKSKQESEEQNGKLQKRKVTFIEEEDAKVKKLPKKSKAKRSELDVIDDGEASFVELLKTSGEEDHNYKREMKLADKSTGGIVTFPGGKMKKAKSQSTVSVSSFSPEVEIGMGGPSTWGD